MLCQIGRRDFNSTNKICAPPHWRQGAQYFALALVGGQGELRRGLLAVDPDHRDAVGDQDDGDRDQAEGRVAVGAAFREGRVIRDERESDRGLADSQDADHRIVLAHGDEQHMDSAGEDHEGERGPPDILERRHHLHIRRHDDCEDADKCERGTSERKELAKHLKSPVEPMVRLYMNASYCQYVQDFSLTNELLG
ncbi:MAG: hypothetical protein JWN64_237 [Parcubacteria group bacterium]|nr:hypothetical protein [Parcubacteria group bacterium]